MGLCRIKRKSEGRRLKEKKEGANHSEVTGKERKDIASKEEKPKKTSTHPSGSTRKNFT